MSARYPVNTLYSRAVPYAVVALLLNEKRQVLAVSRKKDHADLGFPGGKVDAGESGWHAAIRELDEETGLVAIDLEPIFEANDISQQLCRCYRVHSFRGKLESKEGAFVGWVEPSRMIEKTSTFRDYNRQLLKHVELL